MITRECTVLFREERQCTYSVTLRRFRLTIVAMEKQCVLHILSVCSLSYPACNTHAPCCHLWPAKLYNIFPRYLINRTIFGKKKLSTKFVFWFSLRLLCETFLILTRIERDIIKNVYWSLCKVKSKAVPLQAWSGPEGSSKLRFPDFMTTAQDGGKVVSLTHRPPLPPGNTPGTHFC
jgi:hypothetical protein